MKKHELEAAIAAAQAELERLQAIEPEELHPMTLPLGRMCIGKRYWQIISEGNARSLKEGCDILDSSLWNTGNYYDSEEQAAAYADAFEVMRLIRRQPGIVDPSSSGNVYRPKISSNGMIFIDCLAVHYLSFCMFPCFKSQQAAHAAIDAVGAERLVRCANWLAGVVE